MLKEASSLILHRVTVNARGHFLRLTTFTPISTSSNSCSVASREELVLKELLRCSSLRIFLNKTSQGVCEVRVVLSKTNATSSRRHPSALQDCERANCSSLRVTRSYKRTSRAVLKIPASIRRDYPLISDVNDNWPLLTMRGSAIL